MRFALGDEITSMVVGKFKKIFSSFRSALSLKGLLLGLFVFLISANSFSQVAVVTFNNYYQSTSSTFTTGANKIAVSTPYISQKVFFRAANSATSFTCVSSNISGDLYLDGTWIPVRFMQKDPLVPTHIILHLYQIQLLVEFTF
jgi:hypothetical protein